MLEQYIRMGGISLINEKKESDVNNNNNNNENNNNNNNNKSNSNGNNGSNNVNRNIKYDCSNEKIDKRKFRYGRW